MPTTSPQRAGFDLSGSAPAPDASARRRSPPSLQERAAELTLALERAGLPRGKPSLDEPPRPGRRRLSPKTPWERIWAAVDALAAAPAEDDLAYLEARDEVLAAINAHARVRVRAAKRRG
jgi:hypothetical protein